MTGLLVIWKLICLLVLELKQPLDLNLTSIVHYTWCILTCFSYLVSCHISHYIFDIFPNGRKISIVYLESVQKYISIVFNTQSLVISLTYYNPKCLWLCNHASATAATCAIHYFETFHLSVHRTFMNKNLWWTGVLKTNKINIQWEKNLSPFTKI